MSAVFKRNMELGDSIAGRLWRIIDREMSVEQIEFEYIAKYGECNHDTLLVKLSDLDVEGKINRVKQGVYEP